MLSKYRTERANPGTERARLTARLNTVQQRIKEVEAQLVEARKHAEFDQKHSNDPYWQLAKQKYIETGDLSSIENFRAKQDAYENAIADRKLRANDINEQKRQQSIYDELNARRDIENAMVDFDTAEASGDKVALAKATNTLRYATEHYAQVTGKEYKLQPKYLTALGIDTKESSENTPHEESTWLSTAPLYTESGAKNAEDYGAYLLQFADNADGKLNKKRLSAANKQLVDAYLAKKEHWDDMGLNDQKVALIKSHMSQEDYDAKTEATKQKRLAAIRNWNALVDDVNATTEQKKAAYVELSKYGLKPTSLTSKLELK